MQSSNRSEIAALQPVHAAEQADNSLLLASKDDALAVPAVPAVRQQVLQFAR